ncbi:MAG: VWA domain-containing protein, partial [Gemmatimonadota bacterium]|nr:VWA domain-containing protein [Gemmatimonadota bacterium]
MIGIGAFHFASGWALLLLVALPVWWIARRRRRQPAIVFSRVPVLARGARRGASAAFALFLLRNLALAAAIIAMARPRSAGRTENVTSEGINIVVAIDISSSMLAQDFLPNNRLEVAKDVVQRFVNARRSDRIGIVAFAGEALTQV